MNILDILDISPNTFPEIDFLKGVLYSNGYGVERDVEKAAFFYKNASQKLPYANYAYATTLLFGVGVTQDIQHGVSLLTELASNNHLESANLLAIIYSHENGKLFDLGQSYFWYNKAAELGNARAANVLASLYECGKGVKQNNRLAYEWYLKAASMNNADAHWRLSEIYKDGLLGQEIDCELAEKYLLSSKVLKDLEDKSLLDKYELAAINNDKGCQRMLGQIYHLGLFGAVKDEKKAQHWTALSN